MILYPTTYVRLLTDVPLDNNYTDTLTWATQQDQIDYFMGKTLRSYSYDDFSYQRYNPGRGEEAMIRVPEVADNLYACNYVMFRNVNFSTKWFYGFVREVRYINDQVTGIVYDIDLFQTWYFELRYHPCFVVREHVNNDTIGANLLPEGLELGEYVIDDIEGTNQLNPEQAMIGVAATFDRDGNDATGKKYGNMYQGLNIMLFPTVDLVNQFIENNIEKADGIVSIFMVPQFIAQRDTPDSEAIVTINKPKGYGSIDGYTPKNNKLFTYPYNFLFVTNNAGNSMTLPYEYFSGDQCSFFLRGIMGPDTGVTLVPANYKTGRDSGLVSNYMQKMSLGPYPTCSYSTDVYKMYLAQNQSQMPINKWSTYISGALGVAGGVVNTIGAAATIYKGISANGLGGLNNGGGLTSGFSGLQQINSGISQILGYNAKQEDHDRLPNQAHGSSNDSADFTFGYRDFSFSRMHIRAEFARVIDDFFTMFGYNVHRVKKPNITGRRSWNYVKTQDCNVTGDIPADDLARIRAILDNGITFWHTTDVGNYNLNNSPI